VAVPRLSPGASVRLPWPRLQPPPRRTERAAFPHSALLPASCQDLCDLPQRQRFGPWHLATAYSTWSARRSLPPGVYPPPQVLQIDGCSYQGTPASHVAGGVTSSRAPSLHGRYPASPLLRAPPPPSRRRPTSRGRRLYGLPSFRGFRRGARRASPVARCALVAVLSLTTPPEGPAASIGLRRALQPSPSRLRARPPGLSLSGPPRVHCRYGPATRTPPAEGVVNGLQVIRFPSCLPSSYGASDSYPDGTDSRWAQQPFLDAQPYGHLSMHTAQALDNALDSLRLVHYTMMDHCPPRQTRSWRCRPTRWASDVEDAPARYYSGANTPPALRVPAR
jgi:hypothetical protein